MAKVRRNPTIKRLAIKQARGATRKASQTDRPGTAQTRETPPRPKTKVLKGQVSLKARATVFAQQQREKRIRSIVGRKGRGRLDVPGRIKPFVNAKELDILQRKAVNSSWVREILLVMYQGEPALGIIFHDGARIVYTQTNFKDFELMAAAGSKGKFIWARYYHGVPGAGSPYLEF